MCCQVLRCREKEPNDTEQRCGEQVCQSRLSAALSYVREAQCVQVCHIMLIALIKSAALENTAQIQEPKRETCRGAVRVSSTESEFSKMFKEHKEHH